MDIKVYPGKLSGSIDAPSSKSYSHRSIIAAALAEGTSEISGVTPSEDIEVTSNAMRLLGTDIKADGDIYKVSGGKRTVSGERLDIDCGESGSTLRFIIPVAAALGANATFHGRAKLPSRPITPYVREFEKKGVTFEPKSGLPITLSGRLSGGEYKLEGDISSQFITGLLLALPLCGGDSAIKLTSPLQSKPYADMTVSTLKKFGVDIFETEFEGLPLYLVKGGQRYKPCDMKVEGDYSQAAFFFAANALGSDVKIGNLAPDSVQGDREIIGIIKGMGEDRKPFTADVSDIPDLVPILAVLGCFGKGTSRLTNAARLKLKESDRLEMTAENLNAIGGRVKAGADFLEIEPIDGFKGGVVKSHNDHRLVMSAAIGALRSESPVIIEGAEAVNKSYPRFFEDFRSLGGRYEVL
ncbi:MAG: 3-phosphoshikimate 1-carboxyvinyltransferase [Ruminococcus sp.]|nr:3-phosphoshikimate 1-carboxyvinyltransferase [Ruminococcus sp.]